MHRLAMACVAAAAVVFAPGLSAQSKPDFSGKWTLQGEPNAMAGGGGGGGQRGRGMGGGGMFCGQECTITQDATTLKVERMMGQNAVSATYKLDGSESKNTQQMGGRGAVEIVSRAAWDGDKLTISTTREMNGNTMTAKTTVSMENGSMVVETSGGMGGQTMNAKQTYKKG
jgi:hypothetical protein